MYLAIHIFPFRHIEDILNSCNEKEDFFIVGSSSPICPSSKIVLSLSVACSSAELQSLTDQQTTRPLPSQSRAYSHVWDKSWAISNKLEIISWQINGPHLFYPWWPRPSELHTMMLVQIAYFWWITRWVVSWPRLLLNSGLD